MTPYKFLPPDDQLKIKAFLKERQHFQRALLIGSAFAFSCSFIWYAVTIATGLKIGLIALGIGYVVGMSVWLSGKGITEKFGVLGAALAFGSVLLGHMLIAEHDLRSTHPDQYSLVNIGITALNNSSLYDIAFALMAAFEGFKFGMKTIVEAREGINPDRL